MSKSACTTKASFVYENTQANPEWGEGLFQAAGCLEPRLQKKQFGAGRSLGWGLVLDSGGSPVFSYVNGQVGGGKGRDRVLGEAGGVDLAPSRNTVKAGGIQQLRTPGLRPLHTAT